MGGSVVFRLAFVTNQFQGRELMWQKHTTEQGYFTVKFVEARNWSSLFLEKNQKVTREGIEISIPKSSS